MPLWTQGPVISTMRLTDTFWMAICQLTDTCNSGIRPIDALQSAMLRTFLEHSQSLDLVHLVSHPLRRAHRHVFRIHYHMKTVTMDDRLLFCVVHNN